MAEWLVRPLGGLLGGFLVLLLAVAAVVHLADTIGRPATLEGLATCDRDFAAGCVTKRNVLPRERDYERGDWLDGTHTWLLIVQGDPPPGDDGAALSVTVRNQAGRGELRAGGWVEAVFVEDDLIWLRLPSGDLLETEQHPRYAVAWAAFVVLLPAGGAVALLTGWIHFGGSGPRWYRRIAGWPPGLGLLAVGVGLLGLMACYAYPRPAPAAFFCGFLLACMGWMVARSLLSDGPARRHGRGQRRGDGPPGVDLLSKAQLHDQLRRLARAGLAGGAERRNGHLYVVLLPSTPVRRPRDHDRIAEIVTTVLAVRGPAGRPAGVAPDLTAGGWSTGADGVRLTLGVGGDGVVDEDGLLEVTVRPDGAVLLACGRGASAGTGAGPPVVSPALVTALTHGALLLAGRLDPDRTRLKWAIAVLLDRLRGAVASDGPPAPLERNDYEAMTRVHGEALLTDAAAVTGRLLDPLWRDLGVNRIA